MGSFFNRLLTGENSNERARRLAREAFARQQAERTRLATQQAERDRLAGEQARQRQLADQAAANQRATNERLASILEQQTSIANRSLTGDAQRDAGRVRRRRLGGRTRRSTILTSPLGVQGSGATRRRTLFQNLGNTG